MLLRSWPGLRPGEKKTGSGFPLFERALFKNSNKGEGGAHPFLVRPETHDEENDWTLSKLMETLKTLPGILMYVKLAYKFEVMTDVLIRRSSKR